MWVVVVGAAGLIQNQIRSTSSGQSVATFSLATSEKFKGKTGDMEERTEWHNIVLWGKLADIAGQYLSKGRSVYIEGRIQTRKWEGKDGHDRYTTEIIGDKMQMLGGKNGSDKDTEYAGSDSSYQEIDVPF